MGQVQPKFLTQAAYARHRGVSRAAVARAVRERRITPGADGLIDPVAADAQWAANSRPRSPAARAAPPAPPGAASHRERREKAEADIAELNAAKMRRELISIAAVQAALAKDFGTLRDALLKLAPRLGPVLAAEADPAVVERLLHAELHATLVDLAGAGERLPDAPGAFE